MTVKSRILIVDDSPLGRETLESLLSSELYTLSFATHGEEALTQAHEVYPDLVLLDVMMPGMDGFEVCRRLRADPLLAEVPIIMVTALDDRESRLTGIEAGADDFISKPFDRAELRARVRTVTRLNRYRRLLQERQRFEWVVTHAQDGYLILDAAYNITYMNAKAHFYLGVPEGQPSPCNFFECAQNHYRVEPPDAGEVQGSIIPPCYLIRPAEPYAPEFWLQVITQPLDEDVYLVQLRDITRSVLLRKQIWEFNSLVRHKLGTPLGVLTGAIDVLSRERVDFSPEEQAQILTMAGSGAKRLRGAIEDIFQFIEVRDLAHPGTGYCSASQVGPLVKSIAAELGLPPVTLNLEGAASLALGISAQGLELILWELLENAQKFHPEQQPHVMVSLDAMPAGGRLRVVDDGCTLPADQLLRIWQPYYQVERYFTGQVPGMGLGLSVVAALVWGLGGSCQAYNRTPGPGIVIELLLPKATSEGEE